MCCFFPCFNWIQRRCNCKEDGHEMLAITEVLRWIVIAGPLFLSCWRHAVLKGYPELFPGASREAMYWGIVSGTIVGASLLLYLPIKIIIIRYRVKYDLLKGLAWRPSVLSYILCCGGPSLALVLTGAKMASNPASTLDPITIVVLQVTVLGLTFTEWMSKLREEVMTYDLITAMADDFFYAYDVIDFIDLATHSEKIYSSAWVYVCFAFAFVSMFKYVPSQPVNITGKGGQRTVASILVSMFCCDVPFVTIRIATLAIYGFEVSDLIHPAKNIALIVFGCMQLYIIYANTRHTSHVDHRASHVQATFSQKRQSRFEPEDIDDIINTEDGTMTTTGIAMTARVASAAVVSRPGRTSIAPVESPATAGNDTAGNS